MVRKSLLFAKLLLLAFIFNLNAAYALNPKEDCQLLDHLVEVNEEWLNQDYSLQDLDLPVHFQKDDDRIQTHLRLVEHTLRKRNVEHLSETQKHNRLALLNVLQSYWKRNLYPKNLYHQQRQPYFVDDFETACAVGYLVKQSGASDLVEQIRTENNYAYIAELAPIYPALGVWAKENGFSLDELAWIQPGYPPQPRPFSSFGNGEGVEGTVNAMITSEDGAHLFMAGNFTSIDGVEANSVVDWNGEEWLTLGDGLEGEVYALEYHDDKLFAAGNFTLLNGNSGSNIAYWDGSTWTSLQNGDMEGQVYALKVYQNRIYAGGDFQKIDGKEFRHLAFYEYTTSQTWKNSIRVYENGQSIDVDGATSVNGPVRCFEIISNNLLVGGDFTLTAPDFPAADVDQLDANYLAYWNGYNWIGALYGSHTEVHALKFINGDLYVGGMIEEDIGFSMLRAGLWTDEDEFFGFFPSGDNQIHQIVEHDGGALIVGGFHFETFGISIYGMGAATFTTEIYDSQEIENFEGLAIFNNTVKAVAEYQGQLVFAGDFDQVNNDEIKNLAALEMSTSTKDPTFTDSLVDVYNNAGQLHIQYENLENDALFALYNLNGQELQRWKLAKGAAALQENISTLPEGAYVYKIFSTKYQQAGKLIK